VVTTSSNIVTITQIEPIAVDFTLPQVDLREIQAAVARERPSILASSSSATCQF
jgi:multidrug efflux system membrane fusion protein